MSSLTKIYGDPEISSPFAYKTGMMLKESTKSFPNVPKIEEMYYRDRSLTKQHIYILQFLYELGPLTQKEIEWAFAHPDVDPFCRRTGEKPYNRAVSMLVSNGLVYENDVTLEGVKKVRYFMLTPSAEVFYQNIRYQRNDLFTEPNAVREAPHGTPKRVLESLSASMFALRLGVYCGNGVKYANRRFMENDAYFDGKYCMEDDVRYYVLSVRDPAHDYGKVLDSLRIPVFKKSMLITVCESMEKAEELWKILMEKMGNAQIPVLYTSDISLRDESAPKVYSFDAEGCSIYAMLPDRKED